MVLGCAWQPGAGVWGGHTHGGDPLARSHQRFRATGRQGAGTHGCWWRCGGFGEFLRPRRQQFFEAEGFRGGFVFPL